jgi:glycerophosphoryl diester phosphodiesterase
VSALPPHIEFAGRKVLLKYHRLLSGNGTAPPNSMRALEEVLEGGAEVIEIDIRLAADNRFVLLHDPKLEREMSGVGPVRLITSDAFARLSLRGGQGHGVTFDEAIDRLIDVARPIKLQIDLKEVAPLSPEGLAALVEAICRLRANPNLRIVVGCLADWNLRALRRRMPDLAIGVDFTIYLDAPLGDQRLPTRVNAYGYLDDHPLGFQTRSLPIAEYLTDRFEAMIALVPGAAEYYVSKDLLAKALDDGFNPTAFLHEKCPSALVDIWTIDPDTPGGERHLLRALESGADQITTNMPILVAEMVTRDPQRAW